MIVVVLPTLHRRPQDLPLRSPRGGGCPVRQGATHRVLDDIADALSLHDRGIPGTRSRIDHVVVNGEGVWVIDSRRYAGQAVRCDGDHLRVGGLDATGLLGAVIRRAEVVKVAAAAVLGAVPVRAVLCFEDSRWPDGPTPHTVGQVTVARPADLPVLLGGSGPVSERAGRRITAVIAHRLPTASA